MKKAKEIIVVNNFKSVTEDEKIAAVKKILVDLCVKEWQATDNCCLSADDQAIVSTSNGLDLARGIAYE